MLHEAQAGTVQGRSQRDTQGGLEKNVTVKRSHEGEARAI